MTSPLTLHGRSIPEAPRAAIVTPCFNAVAHLEAALRSVERVAAQVALEHVVADGGSKDGTVERLQAAPLVRGISQRDAGLYDALSWTLREARAEYVQWLNADDELPDGFLVKALEILDAEPALDLVLGSTEFVDEAGKVLFRYVYDASLAFDMLRQAEGYFFNLNSAVIRRASLQGADFDQRRFPIGADRDAELQLVHGGVRARVLPDVAYRFRMHGGSITTGEAARIRVQLERGALYRKWSRVPDISAAARAAFARSAKQALVGAGMKQLRTPGKAAAGLGLLIDEILLNPRYAPSALVSWVWHRWVRQPGVPMRVDP